MSLHITVLAVTALSLFALQTAQGHLLGDTPMMRRSCTRPPSVVTNLGSGLMRLRGGIEYYENRMDVQEAITALKQAKFLSPDF